MKINDMILAQEFCIHNNVELSFIHSLKESGLLKIMVIEEQVYVPIDDLCELEKMVRFYEMGINLEGIETIQHLLHQMKEMNQQIVDLHNRLQVFE